MLNGYTTYSAALGLLGLAIYKWTEQDYAGAVEAFLGALAAFGLRRAVSSVGNK